MACRSARIALVRLLRGQLRPGCTDGETRAPTTAGHGAAAGRPSGRPTLHADHVRHSPSSDTVWVVMRRCCRYMAHTQGQPKVGGGGPIPMLLLGPRGARHALIQWTWRVPSGHGRLHRDDMGQCARSRVTMVACLQLSFARPPLLDSRAPCLLIMQAATQPQAATDEPLLLPFPTLLLLPGGVRPPGPV